MTQENINWEINLTWSLVVSKLRCLSESSTHLWRYEPSNQASQDFHKVTLIMNSQSKIIIYFMTREDISKVVAVVEAVVAVWFLSLPKFPQTGACAHAHACVRAHTHSSNKLTTITHGEQIQVVKHHGKPQNMRVGPNNLALIMNSQSKVIIHFMTAMP